MEERARRLLGHAYVSQRTAETFPSKYQDNACFSLVTSAWKSIKIIGVLFLASSTALSDFGKRIVQRIHKYTALQVDDGHFFIVTFHINDSFSWNSCWIIERSYHFCGIFNEIKNRFVIKGMIPKRLQRLHQPAITSYKSSP